MDEELLRIYLRNLYEHVRWQYEAIESLRFIVKDIVKASMHGCPSCEVIALALSRLDGTPFDRDAEETIRAIADVSQLLEESPE